MCFALRSMPSQIKSLLANETPCSFQVTYISKTFSGGGHEAVSFALSVYVMGQISTPFFDAANGDFCELPMSLSVLQKPCFAHTTFRGYRQLLNK